MQIAVRCFVEAPPDAAFSTAIDISNWPRFISSVQSVELLTPGPVAAGTRFRETRSMFGRQASEDMTLAQIDPPRYVAIHQALLSGLLWRRGRSLNGVVEAHGSAEPRAPVSSSTSVVWRDRIALMFFASSFLMNVVFVQHQGAMPLYLVRDLHYRESFYGGLFVLNTLIIVALEVPINMAMAHWSARPATALAMVLVAIGYGALAVAQAPLAIALTVVVWTFGEMIFFPTATAHVAELAPPGRIGEYMGAFAGTFSLALIVGPWLGVALLDRIGAPAMWSAMFVCGLAAAALGGLAGGATSRRR